ncbi:hypothetical protein EDD18DRAFT_1365407 [Armillaria luteobubalina]|uniref:Uncharacterized protein n=1 Tax=Armillaria luteobubalina TaxID=153913 RepID=A0AA39P4M6_9AGAR|nr:hypothetical protein EDD18DRAFT_1365407 [Armillaria luteobubalina]
MVGVQLLDVSDGSRASQFDSARYPEFLEIIDRFESDLSFPALIESYTTGTHPYFQLQASILSLSTDNGERFYGCMLDIIKSFEDKYPRALLSPASLPSAGSLPSPPMLSHVHNGLPFEVLERIFTACAFTHNYIRLRMNADWQYWVGGIPGKRHADLYAFAVECAVSYMSHKWGFASWVVGVTFECWPSTPAPFFFKVFTRVREVVYHGKSCRLRSYPVIGYPRILPASVVSLRIIRCCLRAYSIECMLALCCNIQSVTIHSVYYGHVMAPLARAFTAADIAKWLSKRRIKIASPCGALELYPPSIKRLSLHVPDSSYVINSTASDARGTPPLLLQLFPESSPLPVALYYLWDDKAFPVCLCLSAVQDLELILSAHMRYVLPRVAMHTGRHITVLRLVFHTFSSAPTVMCIYTDTLTAPPPYVRHTDALSLSGFVSLLDLQIETAPCDIESVMLGCATWCSTARLQRDSSFTLCLSPADNRVQLERALTDRLFLSVLGGTAVNDHRPLCGSFGLGLRTSSSSADQHELRTVVDIFLARIVADSSVCSTVRDTLFC